MKEEPSRSFSRKVLGETSKEEGRTEGRREGGRKKEETEGGKREKRREV